MNSKNTIRRRAGEEATSYASYRARCRNNSATRPTICRKCYVHPEVLNAYMDGALKDIVQQRIEEEVTEQFAHLSAEELMVLAFLRKRLG